MKGTPEQPRCGFSMRVVGVLDSMNVEYAALDVLPALEPLRQATGEIADWRTFPQLYVKGELLGGCDIVEEMADSGELAEMLGVEARPSTPSQRRARRAPSRNCSRTGRTRARRCRSRTPSALHDPRVHGRSRGRHAGTARRYGLVLLAVGRPQLRLLVEVHERGERRQHAAR